jgi:hypothetical protein
MLGTSNRCPADPEEVAERYCLGSLPRVDAVAFEDHFLTCARCASIVETADQFRAMKVAAQRLRPVAGNSESDAAPKTFTAGGRE